MGEIHQHASDNLYYVSLEDEPGVKLGETTTVMKRLEIGIMYGVESKRFPDQWWIDSYHANPTPGSWIPGMPVES
jgi:hypothetical protein